MLTALDAGALRRWCAEALAALTAARAEIDRLNVYPVPDGDTGTNLMLTLQAVVDELPADVGASLADTATAMAYGALIGARGNSGVIVSQLLRGLAEAVAGEESCTGSTLQRALDLAADLAYAAVADPVEGTLLSVARAASVAASETEAADLEAVVTAAAAGARAALARTPSQLPALAAAGVVDAGGRGLVVVLDALVAVVAGGPAAVPVVPVAPPHQSLLTRADSTPHGYTYEVQYLLDAVDVSALRGRLAGLGDSLAIVGGDGRWNVHVHVDDVGAAIEAGVQAGRPHRISVTRFADQVIDSAARCQPGHAAGRGRAVVAVASGDGLVELFRAEGAHVLRGGENAKPSTGELVAAIRATGAVEVVVLPNDANLAATASAAAREAREQFAIAVEVVATTSYLQGLAALAVAQAGRHLDDEVVEMASAARATRCAAVTIAVRAAHTDAGHCVEGDALGLVEDEVVLVGHEVTEVATTLVDMLLAAGGELVTVLTGAQAPPDLADRLAANVANRHPGVRTVCYHGAQPHYLVLLGVE